MSALPPDTPPSRPESPAQPAPWEKQVLEKLVLEVVHEKRRARRWSIFFRFVFLGILALVFFGGVLAEYGGSTTTGPHTALIELNGEISISSSASADNINTALQDAFANPQTKGVILRINSPGGSPVQASQIFAEIERLRAKYNKPVYAVCEEVCASGAYYVAAAANDIYVNPASLVGSIGVLMDGFGFSGLMDKLGVTRRLLTAGANKGFMDPFTPMPEDQKTYALGMLQEIHKQFIAAVEKGRGSRLKVNDETFSGLVWTGESAVKQGLADGYGDVDQIARDKIKAPDIVDYTLQENVAERLVKRFGASLGMGAVHELSNLGWSLR
ncbi:MAG: S49 family peptidase [Thiomonas sp.]|nr:S49 family peptidase [Thiomonas sp.]